MASSDISSNDIDSGLTNSAAGAGYTVVARRYRPQTFEELIGQGHVAKALQQAIATERVGHAYLFTGARGVGKTSAARILAKALNCIDGPGAAPCNKCDICVSISSGDDVDVLEIDGASNRGIDEIRQLRQNVAVRPSRSRYKIYIIDEVHMLTKEAFNALLKTLEEPPEHVKFIFATTEPNKIPITILSRCQRFDFAGIDSSSIQTRLEQIAEAEGVGIEPAAVQILASRAAGSMRDSQSLLEQLLAVAEETITAGDVNSLLGIAPAERLSRLLAQMAARNGAGALAELDEALAGGVEVGQLLDQLIGNFRDVMVTCAGCGSEQLRYALPTQGEEITELGNQLGVQTVLAIMQILDQTAARMRVSVYGRELVEMAVVRICNLENLDDLANLVDSLGSDCGPVAPGASPQQSRTPNRTNAPAPVSRPAVSQTEPVQPSQSTPPQSSAVSSVSPEAPAAEAAPPKTILAELAPAEAFKLWENIAGEVGGLIAGYSGMTDGVVSDKSGTLAVRFRHDASIAKQQCELPSNMQQLEQAAANFCGTKVKLRFDLAQAPSRPADTPSPNASRRQQSAEIGDHPFVKKALTLFDVEPGQYRYTPPSSEG